MKELIEHITGKRLMKRWGKDEHELFQIVQKGLPTYEPWEDMSKIAEFIRMAAVKTGMKDFSLENYSSPKPDYIDSAGNLFRYAYPERPGEIPSLIFRIDYIEYFENEYGLGKTKERLESIKEEKSLTEKSRNSFCRTSSDHWQIVYKGIGKTFNHLKGFQYISFLLNHPNEGFYPSELAMKVEKNRDIKITEHYEIGLSYEDKQKYQDGAKQVYERIIFAEDVGDPVEIEKAKDKWELCKRLLSDEGIIAVEKEDGSIYFNYKSRLNKDEERERTRIAKNIQTALNKIKQDIPELEKHLDIYIKKAGNKISYNNPEPYTWK